MAAKGNTNPEAETTEEVNEQAAAVEKIITADAKTLRPTQRAVLQMLHWLEQVATEDTEDRTFTGDDIASIILANEAGEMWEADELQRYNAKILSGAELDIYGFGVKFSNDPEIASGLIGPTNRKKMYLLVSSARLNDSGQTKTYKLPNVGEEFVWNTSARYIVAKLYWLQTHGYFDDGRTVKAKIQGTELSGGKSVEKLKELPGNVPF